MKRFAATVLFAVLAVAAPPAFAEDSSSSEAQPEWPLPPYADQQMCYTWIALMGGYAEPADRRDGWQKIAGRIASSLSGRTDVTPEAAKTATDAAIAAFSDWVKVYYDAVVEERVRLILDTETKANNCMDMVPPEA